VTLGHGGAATPPGTGLPAPCAPPAAHMVAPTATSPHFAAPPPRPGTRGAGRQVRSKSLVCTPMRRRRRKRRGAAVHTAAACRCMGRAGWVDYWGRRRQRVRARHPFRSQGVRQHAHHNGRTKGSDVPAVPGKSAPAAARCHRRHTFTQPANGGSSPLGCAAQAIADFKAEVNIGWRRDVLMPRANPVRQTCMEPGVLVQQVEEPPTSLSHACCCHLYMHL
jgi:hypothetical protein